MKSSLAKLFLTLAMLASALVAGAADRWETLRAINWVENPDNHSRPGRHGELGPYQFRAATWRMHTDRPFNEAVQRSAADEVAVKHYEWIKRSLTNAGVEATPFNIAMAWNCGVEAVRSGRVPTVSYNYAVRVNNLVDVLKERSEPLAVSEDDAPAVPNSTLPLFRLDEGNVTPQPQDDELHFRIRREEAGPRFVLAAAD